MKPLAGALTLLLVAVTPACSQESTAPAPPSSQTQTQPLISAAPTQKIRVYVTDSNSWQMVGSSGGAGGAFGGGFAGGASPQTAEVIKTLSQRCPTLLVNERPSASDYVIRLEHEGGKGLLRKKDKVAVFQQKSGDSIYSASTLSVGGSVQGACEAIEKDWPTYSAQTAAAPAPPLALISIPPPPPPPSTMANLSVESSVTGADIEIDGSFVGSTPSTLSVAPGQHTVAVKKKGYADWSRSMNIAGNAVHLNADLTATP